MPRCWTYQMKTRSSYVLFQLFTLFARITFFSNKGGISFVTNSFHLHRVERILHAALLSCHCVQKKSEHLPLRLWPQFSEYVINCGTASVSWIFMVFLIRRLFAAITHLKKLPPHHTQMCVCWLAPSIYSMSLSTISVCLSIRPPICYVSTSFWKKGQKNAK